MVDAFSMAGAVVAPAMRTIFADQRMQRVARLPLSELIDVTIKDNFMRRKVRREYEAVCDDVARRLEDLCEHEWRDLDGGERIAAMSIIVDAFTVADLSDEALLTKNLDAAELVKTILSASAQRGNSGLSDSGNAYLTALAFECAVLYTQLVANLPSFAPRGIVELLNRSSSLSQQIEELLDRLPRPTLDAPQGAGLDETFKRRYLTHLASNLDHVDFFGVDIHRYRPRTTLSVAYISLAVTREDAQSNAEGDHLTPSRDIRRADLKSTQELSVGAFLGESGRYLLRGEAGSGKSTVLRWLAVNVARQSFTDTLPALNKRVPFLIKLRTYSGGNLPAPERFLDGAANAIVGLMPAGWVHRQFSSGNALLMLDGLDELPKQSRRHVRPWLEALLIEYPDTMVVVTTRPSAAPARWLAAEGFQSALLERMGHNDIVQLVIQWHAAALDAGSAPCTAEELREFQAALLTRIESSAHLRNLASSPLMCAMLCALNLDRQTALPLDRISVYESALELLLHRRDFQRGMPSSGDAALDMRAQLQTLQYLAWRMSINGRTEVSKEQANERVQECLRGMPLIDERPDSVLAHLLGRSGVLREPIPGRIDFIHRTFQEYLTAREAAEGGDTGFLIGRAHLDTWHETIVLAAGRSNGPTRRELIEGIINRATIERRHARKLKVLAVSCLETMSHIDVELTQVIERCLRTLLPPRTYEEAQALSHAGRLLVKNSKPHLSGTAIDSSRAMVYALSLVGTPEALDRMGSYAAASLPMEVYFQIWEEAKRLPSRQFGEVVLSRLAAEGYRDAIVDQPQFYALRHVTDPPPVRRIQLESLVDVEAELHDFPLTREIWLQGDVTTLRPFSRLRGLLEELIIWSDVAISDLDMLAEFPHLRRLSLSQAGGFDSVDYLLHAPNLDTLWLNNLDRVEDFGPVSQLRHLRSLRLVDARRLATIDSFASVDELVFMGRGPDLGSRLFQAGLDVSRLQIDNASWLTDLSVFSNWTKLRELDIDGHHEVDLRSLPALPLLERLSLDCRAISDFSALSRLPSLKWLALPVGWPRPRGLPARVAIDYGDYPYEWQHE